MKRLAAVLWLATAAGTAALAQTPQGPMPDAAQAPVPAPAPAQQIPKELPAKLPSSTPVPEATLDLEWETVEDAAGYQVKLTPVEGGEPLQYSTKENKLNQRLPLGEYRLQIRSQDKVTGYFGPWSDPMEVEVRNKTVELILPENDAEIAAPTEKRKTVAFEWSPAEGAKKYNLRVWWDDSDKAVEFETQATKKELSLPTARRYHWNVTFITDKSIGYRTSPKTFSFTLLGKQLVTPVVEKKMPLPIVAKAAWSKSPGAQWYEAKILFHYLDETEWQDFKTIEKIEENSWNFDRLKPGAYRIEVIAHAKNRVSSDAGTYEFVVKPTQDELLKAMEPTVGYVPPPNSAAAPSVKK